MALLESSYPKSNIIVIDRKETKDIKVILRNLAADLKGINIKEYHALIESYDKFLSQPESSDDYLGALEKLSMDCNHDSVKHPDWSLLGGRINVQKLWVLGVSSFSEMFLSLPKIHHEVEKFVRENRKELDSFVVKERDLNFTIFAVKTLEKSYLIKNLNGKIEDIQHLYMRVAVQIGYPSLPLIKKIYDHLSLGYYAHATPTLFNAGRKKNQMSSCFGGCIEDSIEDLGEWWKRFAIISQNSGGIGMDFSSIRMSELSTGESTTGLGGWLKITEEILEKVDQARKRKGSLTAYLNVAHAGVIDFIKCKEEKASGDCAPKLFYGLMMSKLFIDRFHSKGVWSMFCPNKSPEVFKTYGKEFVKAYLEAEARGEAIKQLPVSEIMTEIVMMQIKKGMPFIVNIDTINERSNQKHVGMIKNSNLCTEIALNSSNGKIFSCNLASISLVKCVKKDVTGKPYFDFNHLEEMSSQLVENLNVIINRNYYPDSIPDIKKTNLEEIPLGIGVQAQADAFAQLGLSWIIPNTDSQSNKIASWRGEFVINPEAQKLQREIYETIYYSALKKSCEFAKIHGAYDTFQGSDMSKGIFQWNHWDGMDLKAPLHSRYGEKAWVKMKEEMMKGVRNSVLVSLMPTASTSHILSNNECFTGDTPVTLTNGLSIAIKDIRPGQIVSAYSESVQGIVGAPVTEFLPRGEKDVIRLTFSDGRTLTCTPDHKFLMSNGEWCEARHIEIKGTSVMMGLTGTPDVIGVDEKKWSLKTAIGILHMTTPRERDISLIFARIVGFIRADGSVQKGKVTAVFDHPIDRDAFLEDIKFLGYNAFYRINSRQCYEVVMTGDLAKAIRELEGMPNGARVSSEKYWPTFIIDPRCPNSIRREFLAGFFGGDGYTPVLVGNRNQTKTFSPIRLSQTACMSRKESLINAMNQLCELLKQTGVPGASIVNIRIVKNTNGDVFRCGEKEHVSIRISLPTNAFTQHIFMDKIGIRYCTHKAHRYGVAAAWSRYLSLVKQQHEQVCNDAMKMDGTLISSLSKSIENLKAREAILNDHYSIPSISQSHKKRQQSTEINQFKFKYVISAEQFLEQIGARDWFASAKTGAQEKETSSKHTYAVNLSAISTPTMKLQLIDRKPAGKAVVYDINVKKLHNFVANGIVVHNCFEPFTENLYKRTVLSGQFTVINKHLVRDLEEIGLWNERTSKLLIKTKGSVQPFTLPSSDPRSPKLEQIKLKYRTAFEIPQRILHLYERDRARFVCQTQSANRFYSSPTTKPLSAMICAGFELGLKTINYYIRSLPAANPVNYALDTDEIEDLESEEIHTLEIPIPKLLDSNPRIETTFRVECTDEICTRCTS